MTSFNVARFENNALNFVVIEVPDPVLRDQGLIDAVVSSGVVQFRMPVVLVGADERKTYGRSEILQFLTYVDLARLPWVRTSVMI